MSPAEATSWSASGWAAAKEVALLGLAWEGNPSAVMGETPPPQILSQEGAPAGLPPPLPCLPLLSCKRGKDINQEAGADTR